MKNYIVFYSTPYTNDTESPNNLIVTLQGDEDIDDMFLRLYKFFCGEHKEKKLFQTALAGCESIADMTAMFNYFTKYKIIYIAELNDALFKNAEIKPTDFISY